MFNCVVFVSGPYNGDVEKNTRRAEEYSNLLWQMGFPNICPHKNSYKAGIEEKLFYKGYPLIVGRCDTLVLLPRWEKSKGVSLELKEAKKWGLIIFNWFDIEATIPTLLDRYTWLGPQRYGDEKQFVIDLQKMAHELVERWKVEVDPQFSSLLEERNPL